MLLQMNPVPLSKTIKTLLDDLPKGQKITVNWMISNTGGRGIYLVFIWLSLPFVVPESNIDFFLLISYPLISVFGEFNFFHFS